MRGTVARRIRAAARQAAATQPTRYITNILKRIWTGKFGIDGKRVMDVRGTVTCTGYRHVYQDMKRAYGTR